MVLAEMMAPDFVQSMVHPQLECIEDEEMFRAKMREALAASEHPEGLVQITMDLLYKVFSGFYNKRT